MHNDKRSKYLKWDGYFLGLAMMASFRSKDPSTQNGACVVDPKTSNILSMGYNGFPRGCSDNDFPWNRDGSDPANNKYSYVEHAERNAIYNAVLNGISLKNSVMYLYSEKGYYPCSDCARAIIQSGIKKVVMAFVMDNDTDKYSWTATKKMFAASEISIQILSNNSKNDLRLGNLKNDMLFLSENFKKISEVL